MYIYDQKFSIQSIQQPKKNQNWMKKKFYIHVPFKYIRNLGIWAPLRPLFKIK